MSENNLTLEKETTTPTKFFMKPTPGKLIVKIDDFRYSGRIVIPDKAKRMPTTGVVVAVSDADLNAEEVGGGLGGYWLGRRIIFGRWSGTQLAFKGHPAFNCLTYEEILAELATDEELELDDTSLMRD